MAANKTAAPKSKATAKTAPKRKATAGAGKAAATRKKAAPQKAATAARKAGTAKAGAAKSGSAKGRPAARRKAPATRKSERSAPVASSQPLMNALRAEHRHMATIMKLFAEQLNAIEAGDLVDTHVVYEIMDYMVTWPDRFHHPREDLIYARVAELDGKAADDVDTLQRDHDHTAKRGRSVLAEIRRWREGEISGTVVVEQGRAYIDHIHEHMNVEEKVVFPHIESVLSNEDWRELAEDDELRAVGESILGPQVQREFRNMTRKLRRSLRRRVERGVMVEWVDLEAFMESVEVVSIAYESARDATGEKVRGAFKEGMDLLRNDFFSAPLKIAGNNARVTFSILGEVAQISRETLGDLGRVNQERKDRLRLLAKNSPQD